MKQKESPPQAIKRRRPLQQRSQEKVALILEAAIQLLDKGDIESLTTNAIAERAGVSIGTLYQYFDGKPAVLKELADREMGGLSDRILASYRRGSNQSPRERLLAMFGAIGQTYGGRSNVHRQLLVHALSQGTSNRLLPMMAALTSEMTHEHGAEQDSRRLLTPAQAFVLTHAVSGVFRGLLIQPNVDVPRQAIELELVELIEKYVASAPV